MNGSLRLLAMTLVVSIVLPACTGHGRRGGGYDDDDDDSGPSAPPEIQAAFMAPCSVGTCPNSLSCASNYGGCTVMCDSSSQCAEWFGNAACVGGPGFGLCIVPCATSDDCPHFAECQWQYEYCTHVPDDV